MIADEVRRYAASLKDERPTLLDLFCGAGGAAMGYHRAGFNVIGVDINPQPNYPFRFIQADAMTFPLSGFDVVHASPPCQGYSRMRHLPWLQDRVYPLLIEPIRVRLLEADIPYIIENVMDAPLLTPLVLCGLSFNLRMYRHRKFECSHSLPPLPHRKHEQTIWKGRNLNFRYRDSKGVMGILPDPVGHTTGTGTQEAKVVMDIEWMTRDEMTQAIPPVYTEYIGKQLLNALH